MDYDKYKELPIITRPKKPMAPKFSASSDDFAKYAVELKKI